ncbi:hypothetical protein RRG08_015863 [Elysia crispata]|uniref:Uncharacterized protein n=1 Tax=Elysia crispata TaxID=231223 RepID=A0AAE0XPG3_9GAST|nr:hypothetical protein RRG08_015863 [Elysia crispata]
MTEVWFNILNITASFRKLMNFLMIFVLLLKRSMEASNIEAATATLYPSPNYLPHAYTIIAQDKSYEVLKYDFVHVASLKKQ